MDKISFRSNRSMGVSAETAFRELEKIRKHSELTPRNVVDAARPAKAPLHPAFLWDDKQAGELYRRYQARDLIRSVVVHTEDDGPAQQKYVHVTEVGQAGRYETVSVVVASPDLYAVALAELQAKLTAALAAVKQLEAAAKGSDDSERLMRVTLAVRAMETAAQAVRSLQ